MSDDITFARQSAALIRELGSAEALSSDELELVCNAAVRLVNFAEWLVAMDDPADLIGYGDRRQVTLTQIIDRAGQALRDD